MRNNKNNYNNYKNKPDSGKGNMEDRPQNIRIVSYFEPDKRTGKFKRVFAPLIGLFPHKMIIWINGKEYVLTSKYNLPQMLLDGNILAAFAYPPRKGEPKELFKLPVGRSTFDPSLDLQINFDYSRVKDRKTTIDLDAGVIEKKKELAELKDQLRAELQYLAEHSAEALSFMKQISRDIAPSKSIVGLPDIAGEDEVNKRFFKKKKKIMKKYGTFLTPERGEVYGRK